LAGVVKLVEGNNWGKEFGGTVAIEYLRRQFVGTVAIKDTMATVVAIMQRFTS